VAIHMNKGRIHRTFGELGVLGQHRLGVPTPGTRHQDPSPRCVSDTLRLDLL
jgi:hypothetical protein